jgi:hypothetical protein
MVDYTPASGNVSAGTVVVDGSVTANTAGKGALVKIAHKDIVNNTLGSLAVGGGVYDVTNLNNAANGAIVYWDGTSKVTTTSTNNGKFGYVVAGGGGGANTTCQALHDPKYDS